LRDPLPVAGIARAMGITRQSVQRMAEIVPGYAAYARRWRRRWGATS
jgi:hypothetical protein